MRIISFFRVGRFDEAYGTGVFSIASSFEWSLRLFHLFHWENHRWWMNLRMNVQKPIFVGMSERATVLRLVVGLDASATFS